MRKLIAIIACAVICFGVLGVAAFLAVRGWMPDDPPSEAAKKPHAIDVHWRASRVFFGDEAVLEVTVVADADKVDATSIVILPPFVAKDFTVEPEAQSTQRHGTQVVAKRSFTFRCLVCLPRVYGYTFVQGRVQLSLDGRARELSYRTPALHILSRLTPADLQKPVFEPQQLEPIAPSYSSAMTPALRTLPWIFAGATLVALAWAARHALRQKKLQADEQPITLKRCRKMLKRVVRALQGSSDAHEVRQSCIQAWYWFGAALCISGSATDAQKMLLRRLERCAFGPPFLVPEENLQQVALGIVQEAEKTLFVKRWQERMRRWTRW